MPLATNPIDINRGTTGLSLTPEQTNEIWANAIEQSVVMQLAQRVTLPGSGISIPIITGDPVADFVVETAEKPVSESTFGMKTMTPYKIAVIELFSDEFRRDFRALYNELVRRLPASIGAKFDETVFHGTAPGTGFETLSGAASVAIGGTDTYKKLVNAYTTVGAAGRLNGWAVSPQGEAILLSATDQTGRPLLVSSINNDRAVSRVLGADVYSSRRVYKAGTPNEVGFAGDWSQARYGIVDGINLSISDQATINTGDESVNLWQRNMFAVRVEAEVSFIYRDLAAFVKLTDATA